MPQYPSYPRISTLVPGDVILAHQEATGSLKTIDFEDLATSVIREGPDVSFPFVNVADHGAIGDGVTDDTIAINSAITAAGPNSVVVFPSGKVFVTTSVITIPHDNVTLLGFGTIITSLVETQHAKFIFNGRTKGRITGIKFNCLYASGGFGLTHGVVNVYNSSDITIDNCDFNDVGYSGVVIGYHTFRTVVANCRFSRCFIGVFSDDDALAYQPVQSTITGNTFRDGLGSTSTALSGAIKLSGLGSETTFAGHVISNNTIINPGQMGIEIQTWVNDCTISNNTIYGAGFGISVSGCARTNVVGNAIREHVNYGLEAASGAVGVNFSNNLVSSAVSGSKGVIIPDTTGDVAVTGCSFRGMDNHVQIQGGSRIAITGCNFYRPAGSCVNVIGGSNIAISGNAMDAQGAFSFIFLDSSASAVSGIVINGNTWTGATTNGITLYAPNAYTISDVVACGNNTSAANFPGGGWSSNASTSREAKLLRIRAFGNVGDGVENWQKNLNMTVLTISNDFPFFYEYYYFENGLFNVNASSGEIDVSLPNASGISGYEITVRKTDSSTNNVIIYCYLSQNINGAATFTLSAQYESVTFRSDGNNWVIIAYSDQ